jgi:hypothetical protein
MTATPGPPPTGAAVLRAALTYFALVFGAGFILGPIRVLLLEPQVGTRMAELMETPLMFVVIVLAARWLHRARTSAMTQAQCLQVGALTVGCVLLADIGVGMGLRGMSLAAVFADRDPVSGTAYYLLLAITALMPWWLGRRATRA